MKIPRTILEDEGIEQYLSKRGLIAQYKKAKLKVLTGYGQSANFGQRQPASHNIRYFRINKQYRAWCSFDDDNNLIVFKVDDHS